MRCARSFLHCPDRSACRIVRCARTLVFTIAAVTCASPSLAQTPIRFLVGYTAGGPVDAAARIVAAGLAKELGGPVVVENRPGANAVLAGDLVAKGGSDASTLWFAASPTITISPNVMKKMPFDPQKDLTPIAPVVSYYNVLVVNRDAAIRSVSDLVALARAQPGRVTYGSAGVGGSNHLSGELFAVQTGTRMTHVPYKGNAPAMTDVIGGQITMMFDIIANARPQIAAGKVRALAVTSPERNPSLPDVPTMAQSGLPGFDVGGWFALYGPPALPAAVAARYAQGVKRVLATPDIRSRLEDMGYELWTGEPSVVTERAAKERAMWSTVTRGIEIE